MCKPHKANGMKRSRKQAFWSWRGGKKLLLRQLMDKEVHELLKKADQE